MSPKKRGGGGKISRRMALLLMGGGAVGSLGVTGAFSSVQGPRPLNLGQKDDDEALLRLMSSDAGNPAGEPLNSNTVSFTASDGTTTDLVSIQNFVGEDIDFTTLTLAPVQGSGNSDLNIDLQNDPSSLSTQDEATVSAEISCDQMVWDVPVELTISAEGETTIIDLSRTFEVTCTHPLCTVTTDFIEGGGNDNGTKAGTVSIVRTWDNFLEIDITLHQGDSDDDDSDDDDSDDNDGDDGDDSDDNDDDDGDDSDDNDDDDGDDSDDSDDNDDDDSDDDDSDDSDGSASTRTFKDVHIDVQGDPCDFPNGLGNYHVSESNVNGTTYSTTIDLAGELSIGEQDNIVIAVHAALSNGESAWADGKDQPHRNNWSMYVAGCYDGTPSSSCGESGKGNGDDNPSNPGNSDDDTENEDTESEDD